MRLPKSQGPLETDLAMFTLRGANIIVSLETAQLGCVREPSGWLQGTLARAGDGTFSGDLKADDAAQVMSA